MKLNVMECEEDAAYEKHPIARYQLWSEDYNLLLIQQGGVCAVCGGDEPNTKNGRFVVDHCHATDRVRGLLCMSCNTSIGKLGDDVPGVLRALRYLLNAEGCQSLAEWTEGVSDRVRVCVFKAADRTNFSMKYTCPTSGRVVVRSTRTRDRRLARERGQAWESEVTTALAARRRKLMAS